MFKKTILLLLALLMVLSLCSCSGGWKKSYEMFLDKLIGKVDVSKGIENTDAETAIRERLSEYSDGNILWFKFDDFDSDGIKEAFAFIGTAAAEYFDGVLWYANENYAVEVAENGRWTVPDIISVDGANFVITENFGNGLSYVYGVEGSKVYQTAVSGTFSHLTYIGGNDFTAEFTSYDHYEDEELSKAEEPTTKLYWFYIKDGEFYEYGADATLKRADLRKYPTGGKIVDDIYKFGFTESLLKKYYEHADEEVLELIAKDAGYFKNIMLRENGIINLNFYGAYDDCYYVTFKINGDDLDIIDEGRGFYLPAAVESIATYPER